MVSKITHLTPKDYRVSKWSGGKTTEISIYPKENKYANRDFLWRLSSATVELSQSDFTNLPSYNRYISLIDGEMILSHKNNLPIVINPFDVYYFDGGIETHCVGKCTDFNLMINKDKCSGILFSEKINGNNVIIKNKIENYNENLPFISAIYCAIGECKIGYNNEIININQGETVLIENMNNNAIKLEAMKTSQIFIAQMQENKV